MVPPASNSRSAEQSARSSARLSSTSDASKSPRQIDAETPSVSPLSQASKTNHDSAIAGNARSGSIPLQDDEDNDVGSETGQEQRDRSSSLSDIEGSFDEQENDDGASDNASTAAPDEENDSEAETERSFSGARPSISQGYGVRKSIMDPQGITAGRKRKRTLLGDAPPRIEYPEESDSDGALMKKRHIRQTAGDTPLDTVERSADGAEDGDDAADEVEQAPTPDMPSPAKQSGRKSKGRAHKRQEPVIEEIAEVEAEAEAEGDDGAEVEAEADADAEVADDNGDNLLPEETESRNNAIGKLEGLSKVFAGMRSRVFGDRLMDAEEELAQLQQLQPTHPEYIKQLQAVTDRRDTKIQQEMKLLQYQKQSLKNQTLGNRAQLLSQYLQEAREIRDDILYKLGQQWYEIQKERRVAQAEELEQYTQTFPTRRSEQVRQQAKYNTEVSILSGVAKYVGFPAAPEITPARPSDMDDDLRAMKIARRQPQPTYQPLRPDVTPRPAAPPSAPTSERLAQKEFIEQTPWANPHHPVHAQSRTPSAFGGQGPPYNLLKGPNSAYSTPQIGVDRNSGSEQIPPGSNETIGVTSDPPSSVLAAPPTGDRIRLIPFEHSGDTSPTAHVKRGPGTKRDFSGLSSASTIDMQPEYMTSAVHTGPRQASQ